jgi:hypothetical protein
MNSGAIRPNIRDDDSGVAVACSQEMYSLRRIARAYEERVDFNGGDATKLPRFLYRQRFRKRHLKALSGLFVQVLALCRKAGLAKLGHVALDGTKIKATASKHKAMSYARMKVVEDKLAAEVAQWVKQAADFRAAGRPKAHPIALP